MAPLSMCACLATDVHRYVQDSPASNKRVSLASPETSTGRHNGSATVTPDKVWFPSLVTVIVYVIGSPAFRTMWADGVLVTPMCGPATAATVAESSPEIDPPRGSLAAAVAVFTT